MKTNFETVDEYIKGFMTDSMGNNIYAPVAFMLRSMLFR